jgi:acyl-CoA reductase-like NAD-dependent aldehyde dehydrogenase
VLIAEGFRECGIPDDVFQVVVGRGPIGEPLIDLVDFIMFTGSTETGRKVMERAAKTLTPMSLELGGKDPMIVLADADLERAANAALFWSMQITGQTCISVERVYVEEPIYDQFSCSSRKRRRSYAKASPATSDSSMSERSSTRPRLTSWRSTSTTPLLAGGHRGLGHGAFFEPTVLADVDHTMESMREETFGPTLPIMKVADADEAIRLANDSPYGLPGTCSKRVRVTADGRARVRVRDRGGVGRWWRRLGWFSGAVGACVARLRAAVIAAGAGGCCVVGSSAGGGGQPVGAGSALSLPKAATSSVAHGQVSWRWSLARRPEKASRPATWKSR